MNITERLIAAISNLISIIDNEFNSRVLFFLVFAIEITLGCSGQTMYHNKVTPATMDDMQIEKWSKAILHLDARPLYSEEEEEKARAKYERNEITYDQYQFIRDGIFNKHRFLGTGIYLINQGKHYIVTARHVIEDTSTWHRQGRTWNKAFDEIIIVQRGQPADKIRHPQGYPVIRGINTGIPDEHPFIFSPRNEDIAVIDLSATPITRLVIEYLHKNNYVPLEWQDIDTICDLKVGQKITVIGFPGNHSYERQLMPEANKHFVSDLVSYPVISDGQIHNPLPLGNSFYGDIFVMKGNSGGPVISNGKLIGVTTAYSATSHRTSSQNDFAYYRRRVAIFTKATLIPDLLRQLNARNSRFP